MLTSIFKNAVEKHTQQYGDFDQTYYTGVVVKTSDVMSASATNPWYLALNGMSPQDVALSRDANKEGYSVVASPKVPNEKYRILVNPLNLSMFSNSSGKTSAMPSNHAGGGGNSFITCHMISQNTETPTLFGVHSISIPNGVGSATETLNTQSQVNENTPLSGSFGAGKAPLSYGPQKPPSNLEGFGPSNPFDKDSTLKPNSIGAAPAKIQTGSDILDKALNPSTSDANDLIKKLLGISGESNQLSNPIGHITSKFDIESGQHVASKWTPLTNTGSNASTGTKLKTDLGKTIR